MHPVVVEHLVIERDGFRRRVRQRVVGCARQPARLRRYAFWSRAPEEARQAPLQERNPAPVVLQRAADVIVAARSEEHTSELQSLMRISYAVFCLKKKKTQKPNEKTQIMIN